MCRLYESWLIRCWSLGRRRVSSEEGGELIPPSRTDQVLPGLDTQTPDLASTRW